jgi:hypothetical protein
MKFEKSEAWTQLNSKEKIIIMLGLIICILNIIGVFYFFFSKNLILMAVCLSFAFVGLTIATKVHNNRIKRNNLKKDQSKKSNFYIAKL